jgi:hypothetical protein
MATKSVEAELLSATNVTAEVGKDRQDFLYDLVQAASKLPDVDYDPLSKAAKAWLKKAILAFNNDQPIPELGAKDTQTEESADTQTSEEDDMKKKVKKKVKSTKSAKTVKTVKNGAVKAGGYKHPKAGVKRAKMSSEVRTGRKAGAGAPTMIKKLCLSHPDWSNEDIQEALKKKEVKVTLPSIRSVRSGFRNSVLVLQEQGIITKKELRV